MSCLAGNINIPYIALNKILGRTIEWTLDKKNCVVSFIEIPKIIK